MSLYSSLTQVLAPFAAKINGLLTGWDGTKYSTPGEAVRQQIADLHVLIGDEPGRAISASAISYGDSDVETALDGVNGRLCEVTAALVKTVHSSNYLDPAEVLSNVQINASGAEEEYSGRNSSGWIPASDGDTVYLTGLNADGALISTSGVSMLRLAWYDSGKNFIGANTWINAYTLPPAGIAYIRFTYVNSSTFQTARLLALMFSAPASAADVEAYRADGYEVVDSVARKNTKIIVPDKFVDAWGDSRIANGGNTTGINKYLADKLGWYTANHGFGGQGSGEIAVSMGAMECYVSIAGNSITNGDNVVTSIKVDHGVAMQNFMQNSSAYTAGVKCSIGGVDGYLWNYGGTVKFTPSSTLSNNVAVMPMTKVIPDPYISMLHRFIVIWAGKNDFSNYTASGLYEYLADVVSAMAEHIPHTRFVILGETTTAADEYKTNGTARAVMDNYNKLMARRFPENFIDIQKELMEHGLEMAGITPTAEDTEYMTEGLLPPSLMSDETHQNPTCRRVIADIIYNHMSEMGWIKELDERVAALEAGGKSEVEVFDATEF